MYIFLLLFHIYKLFQPLILQNTEYSVSYKLAYIVWPSFFQF